MPEQQPGANPPQPVAVRVAIGTMEAVPVEALVLTLVVAEQVPIVHHRRADVEAAGGTMPPAHANKPHQKDATTSRLQAAEADFIGTLVLVHAAPQPPHPAVLQLPEEVLRLQAAHARQAITGCLTMAAGACPTAQAAEARPRLHQARHRHLLQRPSHHLHLPQVQLRPNPLRHHQARNICR